MTITVPLLGALDSAWSAIRDHHPELPEVVVTIGSGTLGERGPGRLGHYASARWERGPNDELPELFIAGEGLDRGPLDVLGTLLHEAAHGLATVRGIADTSRQGRYHNTRYAELAREVGLNVEQGPKFGWAVTHVPGDTAHRYAQQIEAIRGALVAVRRPESRATSTGRTSSNNPVAALCACPRRIRVAPSVLEQGPITCGMCEQDFTTDDAGE
ncbi:hypothetical protein QTQ03_29420 [Micromonospora sp. WMMA1363]|uniref:hypothetical protein n=1 Tax=Micromonospora sp. WMMA1363 TaxID=3053985 RepID=UPI00259CB8D8|nr:hypothetical protein [Micromonospora sp. WMMA1363]MDM4723500.1 hypothetical protein [Micromonospora sp. WMMA1363]